MVEPSPRGMVKWESSMSSSVINEINDRIRVAELRNWFVRECCQRFKFRVPPRETFNRWLQDVYSSSHLSNNNNNYNNGSNCSFGASHSNQHPLSHAIPVVCFPDSLLPRYLTDAVNDDLLVHLDNLRNRVAAKGVSCSLFWELIDKLGGPIEFPRSSKRRIQRVHLDWIQHDGGRKHHAKPTDEEIGEDPTFGPNPKRRRTEEWMSGSGCQPHRSNQDDENCRIGENSLMIVEEEDNLAVIESQIEFVVYQTVELLRLMREMDEEEKQPVDHCSTTNNSNSKCRSKRTFSVLDSTDDNSSKRLCCAADKEAELKFVAGVYGSMETFSNKIAMVETWSSTIMKKIVTMKKRNKKRTHCSSFQNQVLILRDAIEMLMKFGLLRICQSDNSVLQTEGNNSTEGCLLQQEQVMGQTCSIRSDSSSSIDMVAFAQALTELRRPLLFKLHHQHVFRLIQTLEYYWHHRKSTTTTKTTTRDSQPYCHPVHDNQHSKNRSPLSQLPLSQSSVRSTIMYSSNLPSLLIRSSRTQWDNKIRIKRQKTSNRKNEKFVGFEEGGSLDVFVLAAIQEGVQLKLLSSGHDDPSPTLTRIGHPLTKYRISISSDDVYNLWSSFCSTNRVRVDNDLVVPLIENGLYPHQSVPFISCSGCDSCDHHHQCCTPLVSSPFCSFVSSLLVLICRYDSSFSSIDHSCGRGFQAALPTPLWDLLVKHFDVAIECFASPLNHFLPNYFSLFPSVDRFYGSLGSFFDPSIHLLSGAFQLNPPFVNVVMERMAHRLIDWLERSERRADDHKCKKDEDDHDDVNVEKRHDGGVRDTTLTTRDATLRTTLARGNSESPQSPLLLSLLSVAGPLTFIITVPNWNNGSENSCPYLDLLIHETNKLGYLAAVIHAQQFEHCYTSYQTRWEITKIDDDDNGQTSCMEEEVTTGPNGDYSQRVCFPEGLSCVVPCCTAFDRSCIAIGPQSSNSNRDGEISSEFPGVQPRRRKFQFDSISPSLMIILQNKEGRRKWPVTAELVDSILDAWKKG